MTEQAEMTPEHRAATAMVAAVLDALAVLRDPDNAARWLAQLRPELDGRSLIGMLATGMPEDQRAAQAFVARAVGR